MSLVMEAFVIQFLKTYKISNPQDKENLQSFQKKRNTKEKVTQESSKSD